MKPSEMNLICICGHAIRIHNMDGQYTMRGACYYGTPLCWCPCLRYNRDNLKYLEECYNEKQRVS